MSGNGIELVGTTTGDERRVLTVGDEQRDRVDELTRRGCPGGWRSEAVWKSARL